VLRETVEPGAMLLRMAPTHVRFGSFEAFYYRRQYEDVARLADYVIAQSFPHLAGDADQYARLFAEAALRTAHLIAAWQAVGFAHGVMNSDNMSILGLTLDYGPFGFMEEYNPGFVCNHSDHHGRYAFNHQADIGYFNLRCLAQALSPLMPPEPIQAALDAYEAAFADRFLSLMRAKVGLQTSRPEDATLVSRLLNLLEAGHVDYTTFFRSLSQFRQGKDESNEALRDFFLHREAFDDWAGSYQERLRAEGSRDEERSRLMNRVNPKYVLRNYLAQVAIERAVKEGDYSEIDRLRELLRDPFAEQPGMEPYAAPPPDWARHIIVSCSS
jgi:hypothetical protein